jgi:hypothetical protein
MVDPIIRPENLSKDPCFPTGLYVTPYLQGMSSTIGTLTHQRHVVSQLYFGEVCLGETEGERG